VSLHEERHGFCIKVVCKSALQGFRPMHVWKFETSEALIAHEHVGLLSCQRTCGNTNDTVSIWCAVCCTGRTGGSERCPVIWWYTSVGTTGAATCRLHHRPNSNIATLNTGFAAHQTAKHAQTDHVIVTTILPRFLICN